MTDKVPLASGFDHPDVRVGGPVRRPCGPCTPAVHALMRRLESRGFGEAPRVLGIDGRGREILPFIDGDALGWTDWPRVMLRGDGLAQLGALLRRYHEAVRGFVPPPGAVWRNPFAPGRDERVRHGDFAPDNTVRRGDRVVGVIDWTSPRPGRPSPARPIWRGKPCRCPTIGARWGMALPGPVDRAGRLRTLTRRRCKPTRARWWTPRSTGSRQSASRRWNWPDGAWSRGRASRPTATPRPSPPRRPGSAPTGTACWAGRGVLAPPRRPHDRGLAMGRRRPRARAPSVPAAAERQAPGKEGRG